MVDACAISMGSTSNEALFIFAIGRHVALQRLSLVVLEVSAYVGIWYGVGWRGKMRGLKEAGGDTLARLPFLRASRCLSCPQ